MKNDFDEKMETYREVGTRLQLSSSTMNRITNMEGKMRKTRIGKKIFIFNLSMLLVVLLVIPVTAYGAYQVSEALLGKVRNADYSQEQIEELDVRLKQQEFSDEDIKILNDLNVNEYGQTYGPDALGADLIEVISDQGEIGYVYRADLEKTEANTITEALQDGDLCKLKVYKYDGRTPIGTFTLTDGCFVN